MRITKSQRGVGMVEVLVALVLLSIGVLGFTALQLRAVDATAEGLNRVQGMSLARDLADRIRANRGGYAVYKSNINTPPTTASAVCVGATTCTVNQMAAYDAAQILAKAATFNASVAIRSCQGVSSTLQCVYVAWDRTTPTDGTSSTDCTNGGSYQPTSKCIVMEAY